MAGVGTLITAFDYNAIQAKISLVLGAGSGDFGYGQAVSSSSVGQYAKITVAQWNNLRTDVVKCRQHQNGVTITNYSPSEPGYVAGQSLKIPTTSNKIKEEDRLAYITMADACQTDRITAPPAGQATREDLVVPQVRTANWNGTLTQYITVTFASYDAARYFFNSGSRFEISGSRTGGTNGPKDQSWSTILTNIGAIYFDRNNTTCTGTGVNSAIGWADLTGSDQQIFEKDVSGTTYVPNRYLVYARAPANNQIVFTIQWRDDSVDSPPVNAPWYIDEDVTGTLTSNFQVYRASGSNVSIPAPSAITTGI